MRFYVFDPVFGTKFMVAAVDISRGVCEMMVAERTWQKYLELEDAMSCSEIDEEVLIPVKDLLDPFLSSNGDIPKTWKTAPEWRALARELEQGPSFDTRKDMQRRAKWYREQASYVPTGLALVGGTHV